MWVSKSQRPKVIRRDDEDVWTYALLEDKKKNRFWRRLRPDGQVENEMGGRCPLEAAELKIISTVDADSLKDLDWSNTIYSDPKSDSGWLAPTGEFTGCPSYGHRFTAEYVLKADSEFALEKKGYAKIVYGANKKNGKKEYFLFDHKLTKAQQRWLLERGFNIEEWNL